MCFAATGNTVAQDCDNSDVIFLQEKRELILKAAYLAQQ